MNFILQSRDKLKTHLIFKLNIALCQARRLIVKLAGAEKSKEIDISFPG